MRRFVRVQSGSQQSREVCGLSTCRRHDTSGPSTDRIPRSSISASGASSWVTVGGNESGRSVGQIPADDPQLRGGAAEGEFGLFGGDEVAVDLVVHIDADPTVDMHGGVGDPVAGIGGPERRGGHFHVARLVLGQPPRGLLQRQAQTLEVDVAVGKPLGDRLEASDRPVELLAGRAYSAVSSSARSNTPSW